MAAAKQCDCCRAYYTPKAALAVTVTIDLHYQGEMVPDLCPQCQQKIASMVGIQVFDKDGNYRR